MNTGIGDASNLGWKLAAVLQARAAATLLESYSAERIAIAYRIVRSTDRIFSFQVSPSWPMRMARRWLTPLIPGLMRIGAARRFMAPGPPDACGEGSLALVSIGQWCRQSRVPGRPRLASTRLR